MATATISAQALGGLIYKTGNSWANCLAATPSVDTSVTAEVVCRTRSGSTYFLARHAYSFDLSPYAGMTITAATLRVYQADSGGGARTVRPYHYDFGPSLTSADWASKAAMAAAANALDPGGPTGYKSFPLTDPALLLTTGGKIIMCMDDEETAPTGENDVVFVLGASSTNKPQLDITYEEGGGGTPAEGTAAATSGASGEATSTNPASGTAAAASDASGAATSNNPASGTVVAESGVSGSASSGVEASGTVAAVSDASGTATSLNPASGTVSAVSGVSGAASSGVQASGTVTAISGVSGAALSTNPAAGTAVAVSGASMTIGPPPPPPAPLPRPVTPRPKWTSSRDGYCVFRRVDPVTLLEKGPLTTISAQGGKLVLGLNTELKATATLQATNLPDLGSDLIRIYYISEEGSVVLATLRPVITAERLGVAARTTDLTLSSVLQILTERRYRHSLTIPAGANAVATAKAMCEAVGLQVVATPSPLTIPTDWTYPAGETTYLLPINELLARAGYWGLRPDPAGRVTMAPYVAPADRGLVLSEPFIAGENCVFLPELSLELNAWSVPNEVVITSSSSEHVYVGVAENADPDDPRSTVNSSVRTLHESAEGLDSDAECDARAERRLGEVQARGDTITFQHSWVPAWPGDAVPVAWSRYDLTLRSTVQEMEMDLGTPDLLTTTRVEVVR